MAKEEKDNKMWLRNFVIGEQPTGTAQTIANIIGGAIFGGGLLGAYGKEQKSFIGTTKGIQSQINAIKPAFDVETEKAEKGLATEMSGYGERAVGQVERGLEARGITDKAVGTESANATRAGLSGAYASAKAALARAKFDSNSKLTAALANYQMGLAEKQYQSMIANQAAKAGIWGALGGVGTSLMGMSSKKTKDTNSPKSIDIASLGDYETGPFRMKGVV